MKTNKLILLILLFANFLSWSAVFHYSQALRLEVCFLDIGMGDSIFIETPFKDQILIDAGPNNKVIDKLEQRMPFFDRKIETIVLTHPDKDHLYGFIEVLKKYKVENVLWNGIQVETELSKEWKDLIEKEGAKIWIAKKGLKIKVSNNQYFEVLYPFESLEGREVNNKNNSSVVLMLNSNNHKILFMGDAEIEVEKWLVEEGTDLKSQVLKVSHHGSKTGTSLDFLEAVQPCVGIICASENNRYGFPAEQTLENLAEYGINVLQTSNFKKDICLIQKKNEPFSLLNQTRSNGDWLEK
jgi:competence protein ComEC